jgi:hypothetical protein
MLRLESCLLVALGLGLSLLGACSATQLGATDANATNARKASAPGAEVFDRECAGCHGKKGEGLSAAPNILGAGALPTYPRDSSSSNPAMSTGSQQQNQDTSRPPGAPTRDPFRNAQDLYDYLSKRMPLPQSRAGSLKPEEYWAVTNFMLVAHGVSVPPGGVTPDNAKSVPISAP